MAQLDTNTANIASNTSNIASNTSNIAINLGSINAINGTVSTLTTNVNLNTADNIIDYSKPSGDADITLLTGRFKLTSGSNLPDTQTEGILEIIRTDLTPIEQWFSGVNGKEYTRVSANGLGNDWTIWVETALSARIIEDDTSAPVDYLDLNVLTAPTPKEGRIFYDNEKHTLSVYSDILDTTLNVGQETYIRVYNTTGATIPNGTILREDGVLNGVPKVAKAIADDFATALTLGVATTDIPNNTFGYTTTFGTIGGFPLNQNGETWYVGDALYLSDTVAGTATKFLPPIGTSIGKILTHNGATGTVFTSINNLLTLPPVGGWMKVIPTQIAPGAGAANFTGFTDVSTSAGITADGVTGVYTIGVNGTYELSLSASFSNINGQNNGSVINVEIFNATTTTVMFGYNIIVGRNDTVASGTFVTQEDFNKDDTIVCRYSEVPGGNVGDVVNIDYISFLVKSILIR